MTWDLALLIYSLLLPSSFCSLRPKRLAPAFSTSPGTGVEAFTGGVPQETQARKSPVTDWTGKMWFCWPMFLDQTERT